MPEYLSPGVYVEEFDSGGPPLEGVSTSTAGFIGLASRGKVEGLPELITGVADFRRMYGSYLSENDFGEYRYLAYAVEHFFVNGGSRCYVMRVAPPDAKEADSLLTDSVLKFKAKDPGSWGNDLKVVITPSGKAKTQIFAVEGDEGEYRVKSSSGFNEGDTVVYSDGESSQYRQVVSGKDNIIKLNAALDGGDSVVDDTLVPQKLISTCEFDVQVIFADEAETYEKVSLNAAIANHVEKMLARSSLVQVQHVAGKSEGSAGEDGESEGGGIKPPMAYIAGAEGATDCLVTFGGGSDGSLGSLSPGDYMGVDNGPGKRTGIQAFIDNDEVSIMAVPGITEPAVQLALVAHCENLKSRFAVLDVPRDMHKVADVQAHRNIFDSNYAAMYHPWLQVFDPLEKRNIFIPPSGSMVGVYSRSDQTRGVHKAPANEVVMGCVGLDCQYNKGEQDILNPKGVNLIRAFTGQGIRVWGARTCTSNALWKYVNVRRLFIFLEETIKMGTNWVVFEPNDEKLWARVRRTLDAFLTRVWKDGALMGTTPAEAFFIDIGRSTMTQDDIDNGKLICVIGVAPVKPAEFVIFRITQKTSESG